MEGESEKKKVIIGEKSLDDRNGTGLMYLSCTPPGAEPKGMKRSQLYEFVSLMPLSRPPKNKGD